MRINSLAIVPSSGSEPFSLLLPDLLPMRSLDVESRYGKPGTITSNVVVGIINSLNFVFGAEWSDQPIFPRELRPFTEAQEVAAQHLIKKAEVFCTLRPSVFDLGCETKLLKTISGQGFSIKQ